MRFALGMLLLALLSSCSSGSPGKSKADMAAAVDDACTVAVRFVDSWLKRRSGGRPVVFSDTPDSLFNSPAPGPWFKLTGEYGTTPSRALLAKAPEMTRDSAVARCPSLRAYLDRAHIPYGAKAVADTTRAPDANSLYPADVLGVTLPSVSPDGSQALTMTSFQSGPMSGIGQFFLLERQPDGGWPAVSMQNLWMS